MIQSGFFRKSRALKTGLADWKGFYFWQRTKICSKETKAVKVTVSLSSKKWSYASNEALLLKLSAEVNRIVRSHINIVFRIYSFSFSAFIPFRSGGGSFLAVVPFCSIMCLIWMEWRGSEITIQYSRSTLVRPVFWLFPIDVDAQTGPGKWIFISVNTSPYHRRRFPKISATPHQSRVFSFWMWYKYSLNFYSCFYLATHYQPILNAYLSGLKIKDSRLIVIPRSFPGIWDHRSIAGGCYNSGIFLSRMHSWQYSSML